MRFLPTVPPSNLWARTFERGATRANLCVDNYRRSWIFKRLADIQLSYRSAPTSGGSRCGEDRNADGVVSTPWAAGWCIAGMDLAAVEGWGGGCYVY